ncbi:mandelate racemase/muconate lactonizing enzyme family protein [Jiangella sp. DSM 45060]|uniref:mandelate racemase/muconate lactonizing enzyme family protein n=1 Tax=Jiangella sp. DSM 45060 TaxID=1798224 RepID=UPI00087B5E71|nr:mandelate racemase/muconate lactonizing enzyme family protein [Jiangella sp. DSM 45060]SDT72634.1 L-alanine-DL-glutamate epimerase [Jiangella sp. DSM 45060]
MRITDIKAAGLRGATPKGGWARELDPDDNVHTLVAVHTDEGVVGIGSVFSSEALVRAALDQLRPLAVGTDPREPDRVSQTLHEHTFWLGRGGAVTHAVSGIDIALWDILGQVAGLPVSTLLGGRYRERVRPYASVLMDDPPVLKDDLARLVALGFTAFKIGWGSFGRASDAVDEEIVRAARETVGPDALLAVDAGGSDAFWSRGLSWAVRTTDMLAGYDVAWFEEALRPDDVDGFAALRRRSRVPISGGEVLTRRQDFHRFLTAGAFDIVQPDTTKGGGLSESRRVAWLAAEFGVAFIPHGWNTAVGLAADLHLAAALPGTELVEYKTGSAYIDELAAGGFALDADGLLPVPSTPGLGLRLDPDALDRYAPGNTLLTPEPGR